MSLRVIELGSWKINSQQNHLQLVDFFWGGGVFEVQVIKFLGHAGWILENKYFVIGNLKERERRQSSSMAEVVLGSRITLKVISLESRCPS